MDRRGRQRLISRPMHGHPAESAAFTPFIALPAALDCSALLLCDHASAALPPAYGDLGLSPGHFARHIAYDIGAGDLTRALSAQLGAPALMTAYSRLLIDPNRGADDPTLVMRISDRAVIPGNARIDEAEIARRKRLYWDPYRRAIDATTVRMCATGKPPALISIHSFTPVWRGQPRPWEAAALWDCDDRLAAPFVAGLRSQGLTIGDNEPYDGALRGDTMFDHATLPGFAHLLIEVRQDLIATPNGVAQWAARLAPVLADCLAAPDVHVIRHYPSRAATPAMLASLRETRL
ncbi:MAG: N-formylglutamate amidohydrolase [Hyphomicrobiales bacterium]|nr:N-formylglutamate amidohydrolase [Hyphomicrobiales bacterium]